MQYLKADTITEVTIGPAVAVGDGFTPVTSLTIAGADEAELIKHGATAVTAIGGTLGAVTNADGYYTLDISAAETDTEGRLTLLINDDSLILPIRHEFMVVNANVFDSLFAVAGTDLLQVDQTEIVGGTVPAPTTTGVPDVNVERWLDTLVTLSGALPDVNVEAMDANSIAAGVMATNSIGILAMAAGAISAGTIAAGELTNIENEIWDALKAAHTTPDSFGDYLDDEITSRQVSGDVTIAASGIPVGAFVAGSITAAAIAAAAMNGKGDWNIGKTGYSLTQTFPANFTDLLIAAGTGEVGADVLEWLGTAVTANTAGIPNVDMVRIDGSQTPATVLSGWMAQGVNLTADSGTTTTLVDASVALDGPDGRWNGAMLLFRSGTNSGRTALVTDFDNASDTLTFTPAMPDAVTTEAYTLIPGLGRAGVEAWLGVAPNVLVGGNIPSRLINTQTGSVTDTTFAAGAIDAAALAADAAAKIRDAILPTQNVAFDNLVFLFVAASDHVTPVTGATGTAVTRSIDGGGFGAGTGTLAEIANGIYQYDASAADMNGGIITFRFTGTGGTPGAPDDAFVTVVTGGGV